MLSCVIVDDDEISRESIRNYLRYSPDIYVSGEASNVETAISIIVEKRPDIVFFDINPEKTNNSELIRELTSFPRFAIIITTASEALAKKAFDLNAIDFLLKPYTRNRFIRAVEKARFIIRTLRINDLPEDKASLWSYLKNSIYQNTPLYLSRVTVKASNQFKIISTEDIFWLKACGNYSQLFVGSDSYLFNLPIGAAAKKLNPGQFVRIHRSQLVNIYKIKNIYAYFNGEFKIILQNDHELKVSRSYKEKFSNVMGIF